MKAAATTNQLISIEHGCFDTQELQQELAQALEDDRKYKLTDDMKKRAIHTAANYDEFKNLVACADLKPVSQKEITNFTSMGHSNNLMYKGKRRTGSSASWSSSGGKNMSFQPPKSLDQPAKDAVEFSRNWRRHLRKSASEDKYKYLRCTGSERFRAIFKTEMDVDLITDLVQVLLESLKSQRSQDHESSCEPACFARDLLQAISCTGRFSLNMEFLDNNQRQMIQELFAVIEQQLHLASPSSSTEWQSLKSSFKVE